MQVIQNTMDIKEDKRQKFTIFSIQNLLEVVLKMKLNKMNNFQMNFINWLLENFKKGKFIRHLKRIFGM